jgi:hypothetical protein
MKKGEVPQDQTAHYAGARKAIYAVDDRGQLTTVSSSGWQAEEVVTCAAAEEYRRLAQDALQRARARQTSPLEFHMYDRRMDLPMLAETSRIWKLRIRWHFRPAVFVRLGTNVLQGYAEALGITVEQLRQLP